MVRRTILALGFVVLAATLAGCDEDGGDQPLIQSFVPASARAGACVHVVGKRFVPSTLDASVKDASARDSGSVDAGSGDAGARDGGARDGGVVADAGAPDANDDLCFDGDPAPAGALVSFGGRAARVRRWDGERIVVEVPAGAGVTRVVVSVAGRQSNAADFEILP